MKQSLLALAVLTFFSCDTHIHPSTPPSYFMTADVNMMAWAADKGFGTATLDYDFDAHDHFLTLWSQTENPLPNGVRYQVGIDVHSHLSKKRYNFNNNESVMNEIGGASGIVYGWKKNGEDDYFCGYSINGFIEITDLTKDNIDGFFEFNAVTAMSSFDPGNDTIDVQNGKFHVPIGMIIGKDWNGPENP